MYGFEKKSKIWEVFLKKQENPAGNNLTFFLTSKKDIVYYTNDKRNQD